VPRRIRIERAGATQVQTDASVINGCLQDCVDMVSTHAAEKDIRSLSTDRRDVVPRD